MLKKKCTNMPKSNGTQEKFTNNINILKPTTVTETIINGVAATITIHNPAIMAILKATMVTETIIMGVAATITILDPAIMVIKTTTIETETIIMGEAATIIAKHRETIIMAEEEIITVNDSPKNTYIYNKLKINDL